MTTTTSTTITPTDKKVVKKLKQNHIENIKTKEEIRDINLEDNLEGDQDEDEKMKESLVKDDQVDRYALTIDDFDINISNIMESFDKSKDRTSFLLEKETLYMSYMHV
ncbi:hypothetical protein DFA_02212 [Cavenderia fasciculata]|uniref:Uncharacterized protein n=1 Tax=Cavenderia fasciculata TaxID=261658 RepID=F4PYU0_CACFS|nr:uncharacterized protein DFA_02212 [Cavenderia fasciculata]EGG18969.1 hypothetical protein DFA_02212 [Cavenderia fasciculata]|eukprot:XP_004357446.1 hypothetical protein DFA_02212 [Cavenderia fasciculata]